MAKYNRQDYKTAIPQIEGDVNVIQEWISSALDFFYPVGTIYETENVDFNPNKVWGGTWQKIEGRVLVGYDEDDTDQTETFGIVGYKGGARGAWRHNHSQNCQFTVGYLNGSGTSGIPNGASGWGSYGNAHWFGIDANGSFNNTLPTDKANMPPYEVIVIWKRIK